MFSRRYFINQILEYFSTENKTAKVDQLTEPVDFGR